HGGFLPGKAEALQRRLDGLARRRLAGKAAGDREVLRGSQIVLHRGRVSEIDELLRVVLAQVHDLAPSPAQLSFHGGKEAAQDAQQAGLAAAVGPFDAQRFARLERKAEPAEQLAPAALAPKIIGFEHQLRSRAWRLSAESGTYFSTFSCVASSTTRGARPASQASTQRSTCRHQRSPCFKPRKRISGRGVTRSLPFATLNWRNSSVTSTHTRWATPSCPCVAQQPSRK